MTSRSVFSFMVGMLLLASASAQTITPNITNEWPNERYTDHNDGTVTDTATGLMWAKCSLGQTGADCSTGSATTMYWQAALEAASNATLAGHSDWRLPNIKELTSLAALDRYSPAINSTVFPNTPSSFFWSSSPDASSSFGAWGVNFNYGYNSGYILRSGDNRVRLVRSSQ
ncbi:MAG: DUF1566 domain-containing protein [Gammaproteobacteria bacterium]|nr:DUF1566 domain-containing protein [Gammaproteobacteria bacterium]